MKSFAEFVDMGGYALWVWPAYGITLIALAAIVVLTLRGLKAREREFAALKSARRGDEP